MLEVAVSNCLFLFGVFLSSFMVGNSLCNFFSKGGTHLEKILAGYVFTIIIRESILLILSTQDLVAPLLFRLILIPFAIILIFKLKLEIKGLVAKLHTKPINVILLSGFLLLLYRQIAIPDLTWDGHTYGVARQLIWISDSSIVSNHISPQLNLFVNEWHTELLSLSYYLMSGNITNLNFGNFEVYIFLTFSLFELAKMLHFSKQLRIAFVMSILVTPSILGLMSTSKGDLLAFSSTLMALNYSLKIRDDDQVSFNWMLLFLYSTLAITSKISSSFAVVAICLISVPNLRNVLASKLPPIFLKKMFLFNGFITVSGSILAARQILNFLQFDNPLVRVATENTQINFGQIPKIIELITSNLAPISVFSISGTFYSLSASFGASFIWFIILIYLSTSKSKTLLKIPKGHKRYNLAKSSTVMSHRTAIFTLFLGFLATCVVIPIFPWSFRYLLPSIFTIYLFSLHTALRR